MRVVAAQLGLPADKLPALEAALRSLQEDYIPEYLREGATGPLTSRGELRNQSRRATLSLIASKLTA